MLNKSTKIETLDGLRGLAILLVLLFHYWQITWLNHRIETPWVDLELNFIAIGGFVGVEIFFFLSGFCLFLPYAKRSLIGGRCDTIKEFAYKRFIKIIPSYLLAIALILSFADVHFASTKQFLSTLASHAFFLNNHLTQLPVINGVFWSLAVEIQFYLIFPFIAIVFRRHPVTCWILMCCIAMAFRMHYLHNHEHRLGYYMHLMPASMDLFACGMIAAYLTIWLQHRTRIQQLGRIGIGLLTTISVLFFVLLFEVINWYDDARSLGGSPDIWQSFHRLTLGLVLIGLSCSAIFSGRLWKKILANKLLVFLSLISYNLYIWHQLIGWWIYNNKIIPSELTDPRQDVYWQLAVMAAAIGLSVACASVLTYLFERPLMKYGIRGSAAIIIDKAKITVNIAIARLMKIKTQS